MTPPDSTHNAHDPSTVHTMTTDDVMAPEAGAAGGAGAAPVATPPSQWRLAVRTIGTLMRNQPVRYAIGLSIWTFNWVSPMAVAFVGEAYFDNLEGVPGAYGLAAILGALGAWLVVRMVGIFTGMWQYSGVVFRAGAGLQRNMLAWLLAQPGAAGSRLSAGEVISRFRDDIEHVDEGFDQTVDVFGAFVVGILSFVVLARIDLTITAVMFLPMIAIVVVVGLLGTRIAAYRTAAREATEDVTGFLGETFGAAQSIKVAGAETAMLAEFDRRNDRRRGLMVADRTLQAVTDAMGRNMVNIAIGLVLVMAAGSLATPSGMTVGEFALFTYLVSHLGMAAWHAGMYLALLRQTGVSVARMLDLMPDAELPDLTRPQPLEDPVNLPRIQVAAAREAAWMADAAHGADAGAAVAAFVAGDVAATPLLSVRGLTHVFESADPDGPEPGIRDADLDVHRGQLVVVTGRVAAGKTTLLRSITGLLPPQSGTITWQGTRVADPSAVMVPPRVASTSQVPRLFSMSLRDNLALGEAVDDEGDVGSAGRGRDGATTWPRCRTAWTPWSAPAACACRAARSSARRQPGCWSAIPNSWSSTTSRRHWTSRPRQPCGIGSSTIPAPRRWWCHTGGRPCSAPTWSWSWRLVASSTVAPPTSCWPAPAPSASCGGDRAGRDCLTGRQSWAGAVGRVVAVGPARPAVPAGAGGAAGAAGARVIGRLGLARAERRAVGRLDVALAVVLVQPHAAIGEQQRRDRCVADPTQRQGRQVEQPVQAVPDGAAVGDDDHVPAGGHTGGSMTMQGRQDAGDHDGVGLATNPGHDVVAVTGLGCDAGPLLPQAVVHGQPTGPACGPPRIRRSAPADRGRPRCRHPVLQRSGSRSRGHGPGRN